MNCTLLHICLKLQLFYATGFGKCWVFCNIWSAEHQVLIILFFLLLHTIRMATVYLLFPKFSLGALWLLNSRFKTVPEARQNRESCSG